MHFQVRSAKTPKSLEKATKQNQKANNSKKFQTKD